MACNKVCVKVTSTGLSGSHRALHSNKVINAVADQ